ncbi:hypothetical protein RchiOBHm_Chr5g0003271 [Rosa chinensis]|uniref:Uncharacterized protein n=1 Tax=Rosa chinensis TaxID=74649 RepID=A0A2P6Q2U4_ROSCH|nr:hypothetical protein RchiOBHm_Chr5g0003271 [Rosa chinensis]
MAMTVKQMAFFGGGLPLVNHLAKMWRSGEVVLILEDDHELVSLDIVSKQLKNFGISTDQGCPVGSYEESLLLLDRKDAISY